MFRYCSAKNSGSGPKKEKHLLNQPPAMDDVSTVACDKEPIHIPGSIQPYGIMLIAAGATMQVVGGAGRIEDYFGDHWEGADASELLGVRLTDTTIVSGKLASLGRVQSQTGELNAVAYRSGDYVVIDLEPRVPEDNIDFSYVYDLDVAATEFERSSTLADLCFSAANRFRAMTGYARVMVYKFLDDDSGVVIAERSDDQLPSLMNHHFPASDIPKQARALYIRNRVRVIADVNYQPEPIRPAGNGLAIIDLSDSTLRSVSPIHIQYLKNMGVAASASISIVRDGILWGLIACHNPTPKQIPRSVQVATQALASSLSRQIKGKKDAELYRERLRLRSQEDVIMSRLGSDKSLATFFERSGRELAKLVSADGFAAAQGNDLFVYGKVPDKIDVRALANHVRVPAALQPLSTHSLKEDFPDASVYTDLASGLLAVTMSTEVPTILLWFRAEHLEVIKWAGNPHKNIPADGSPLSPRTSFAEWTEQVKGQSKPWTLAEIEASTRIVRLMLEHRNNHRMRELNRELATTLKENETLMRQKDYLLKEVNHRVQNSLQLVSAFLRLQSKSANDNESRLHLDEAQKRLMAVALVHRRLYQDESIEVIDLSRYLEDLCIEMKSSMDAGWDDQIEVNLAPILVATERAVNVGLILTELIINANKYAYGGKPGPLSIDLEQHRASFRLIVSDRGNGKSVDPSSGSSGFGSRMLSAIVERLGGHVDEENNQPGLRTIITAPI